MVAPLISFNGDRAPGAIFHIMSRGPLLEELVCPVPIRAIEPVVRLGVAMRADPKQARRALHDGPLRACAINLQTVRGRAVVQFLCVRVYVGGEGRLYDRVEFIRLEDVTSSGEGDTFLAFRLVAEAFQRETPALHGSKKILNKTSTTPCMTAGKSDRGDDLIETHWAFENMGPIG